MTESQAIFNPQASVFVAANAGSGKTSLLVNRVLSLLLAGIAPHKILCLTYTNAAAAEMAERVTKTLGAWVMMEESLLKTALEVLSLQAVDAQKIKLARSLFARVIDAPSGMKLQTIHGFCGSLLARFPLEAGVGMHLSILDDHTQHTLMKQAQLALYSKAEYEQAELKNAIYHLVQSLGEFSLRGLFDELLAKKQKLRPLLNQPFAQDMAYQLLGVDKHDTPASIIARHINDTSKQHMRELIAQLVHSFENMDVKLQSALAAVLGAENFSEDVFWNYFNCLVKKDGEPRKKIISVKSQTESLQSLIEAEQENVLRCARSLTALRDAQTSEYVLRVVSALMKEYERLKTEQGLLDFDDQILSATHLLTQSGMAAWVLYKLDGGIDHLLIDEAQDTSAPQWSIVRALSDEFLSGIGAEHDARSLFVVGDEKQSIFRFQGADPTGFARARKEFSRKLDDALLPYHHIALTHSYRSAPEILQLVDSVFAEPNAAKGLSADNSDIVHQVKRVDAKGYAALWPISVYDDEHDRSARFVLADKMAAEIDGWLSQGAFLPAKNRCVQAGDIMVLVRKRSSIMGPLSRALKRRGIPVAGVDRVNLLSEIAIADVLAFAKALLLPEDDLNLAALLKSPIFGISESQLFDLCYGREKQSLWARLSAQPDMQAHYALLAEFRAKVDFVSPYEIFSELLDVRGFRRIIAGRMGGEVEELLDELLEQALLFERNNTPSMQGFLAWMEASDSDIKRDMEQAGSMVRIMTVHGSKGLQAPIVFVADTTSIRSKQDRLIWCNDNGISLPILPHNRKQMAQPMVQAAMQDNEQEQDEYRRLLYVALTRAEDWLIVCGTEQTKKKANVQDGSWYKLVEAAFGKIGEKTDDIYQVGTAPAFPTAVPMPQSQPAVYNFVPPAKAPAEPTPSKPLSPSKLLTPMPAEHKPLQSSTAMLRGNALHKIFQLVPTLPESQQHKAAKNIALEQAGMLDENQRAQLVQEAFSVMRAPQFSTLFSADALAEVPVCGVVAWKGNNITVSGQIDRLWVGESELWIVDFKSSANPPDAGHIPSAYIQQMTLYKALLAEIYPNHTIKTGLLWTAIARLDWLSPKHLDETPAGAYI